MDYPKVCPIHNIKINNKSGWANHMRLHTGTTNKGMKYLTVRGKNHYAWKGNEVSYGALHDYIKYYLKAPKVCENCKQEKKLDLCNKSGEYKREFSDWKWLCRKCHQLTDGRWLMFRMSRKYYKFSELNI